MRYNIYKRKVPVVIVSSLYCVIGDIKMDIRLPSVLCLVWVGYVLACCSCGSKYGSDWQPRLCSSILCALPENLSNYQWSGIILRYSSVSSNSFTPSLKVLATMWLCRYCNWKNYEGKTHSFVVSVLVLLNSGLLLVDRILTHNKLNNIGIVVHHLDSTSVYQIFTFSTMGFFMAFCYFQSWRCYRYMRIFSLYCTFITKYSSA